MSDDVVLAERRRRKKWTLNPRGKFWTDDDNKLGQKMLEKMGWSKGKGLGSKLQGMSDPIQVHGNNESKGLGFQGNPDQWLNHQEDFDDILASLNASNPSGEHKKPTSLEERSKASRSRVHYHKFTRGKDLSNWKESDLACIFGKKSSRKQRSAKQVEAIDEAKPEPAEEEEIGTVSNQHGVTVIRGGTMADYFAKKMKSVGASVISRSREAEDDSHSDVDERPSFSGGVTGSTGFGANSWVSGGFQGGSNAEEDIKETCKPKKKVHFNERLSFSDEVVERVGFGASSWVSGGFQEATNGEINAKETKKSKKKKRLEENVTQEESHIENSEYFHIPANVCQEQNRYQEDDIKEIKKKKKRKHKSNNDEENDGLGDDIVETKKKSKKKKKRISEAEEVDSERVDMESLVCDKGNELEDSGEVKKKKKKRKKEAKENSEDHDLEPKKKKNKRVVEEFAEIQEEVSHRKKDKKSQEDEKIEEEVSWGKKEKRKKRTVEEDAEIQEEVSLRKKEKRKEKGASLSNDYQWQQCGKETFNNVAVGSSRTVKSC